MHFGLVLGKLPKKVTHLAMKILFISYNRLGDAVLSSGLLAYLIRQHPNAQITIACGPVPAPLLALAPKVVKLIKLNKLPLVGHWRQLWAQTVGQRWDMVVDLRSSLMAWLLWTRKRKILYPREIYSHRIYQLARVFDLQDPPAPELWLRPQHKRAAEEWLEFQNPILALGPIANWGGKQWPIERYLELARRLTAPNGLLPGARVAVFGAEHERAAAIPLLNGLPVVQAIDLMGQIDLPTVLACLKRCDLYVGNDSGLMHTAAAAQIPTLGLFGPSREEIYGPWGDHAAAVRTDRSFEDIRSDPAYDYRKNNTWMTSLSVDKVEAATRELMAEL